MTAGAQSPNGAGTATFNIVSDTFSRVLDTLRTQFPQPCTAHMQCGVLCVVPGRAVWCWVLGAGAGCWVLGGWWVLCAV